MQSLAYITLDLQDVNASVVVSAKQNDRLSRTITAQLRDGGVAWVPGSGVAAAIRYRKPDGHAGFYDVLENGDVAYELNGSVFTFTLAEQMLTTPGEIPVEINFYSPTGEKLTTFIFWLRVQASVLSDAEIVSGDYYNVLTDQVAQAVAAAAEAAEIFANLPKPSDAAPQPLGSAAPGASARYSRDDHSHPMPSASDVGAVSADNVQLKIYNSVTDVGLTRGSATIAGAFASMPNYTILYAHGTEFASGELPSGFYGYVWIVRGTNAHRSSIEAKGSTAAYGDWRMFLDSSGVPTGTWVPVIIPGSGCLQVRTKSTAKNDIPATNSQWQSVTPDAISNYQVAGIVGWRLHCDNVALWAYTVNYDKSSNKAQVAIRNPSPTAAQNCYADFDILYIRD